MWGDRLQVLLFAMVSMDHDQALLTPFIDHYIAVGIPPSQMYLTMHSQQQGQDALARHVLAKYAVNYRVISDAFNTFTKFEIQVCHCIVQ